MFNFTSRNLMLFFKDKTAVVLSFFAELIVVGLYLLFIRKNLIQNFPGLKQPGQLMDLWMMAGILGITSVSTTFGAYGIMVEDKAQKIQKDFLCAPVRSTSLLGGYLSAAVIIGFFMTFFLFLIAELTFFFRYGIRPGADRIITVYLILFLTTTTNASLTLLLVSFLKTSHSLAACCTILGSLIGFLTGIYLPMGVLPSQVRMLVTCFPVSHGVVLFRQALMEPFLLDTFGSVSSHEARAFMEYMGIQFSIKGHAISWTESVWFLLATLFLCTALSFWKFLADTRGSF